MLEFLKKLCGLTPSTPPAVFAPSELEIVRRRLNDLETYNRTRFGRALDDLARMSHVLEGEREARRKTEEEIQTLRQQFAQAEGRIITLESRAAATTSWRTLTDQALAEITSQLEAIDEGDAILDPVIAQVREDLKKVVREDQKKTSKRKKSKKSR